MNHAYLLNATTGGHGPTLVLVHGVAGSSRIWEPVVSDLAKTFTVVRVDLLGYGHSPKPDIDYTPEIHVASIRHTLNALGIKPPFVMAGLSMGSLLVLEYAKRWPADVSQLLCIGAPFYTDEAEARGHLRHSISARLVLELPALGRLMIQGGWRVGRHNQHVAGLFAKPYTPLMAKDSMRSTHRAFSTTLMNCLVLNRPEPLLDATTTIPQSYLQGELDRYSPLSDLRERLAGRPNCSLTVLPGIAHNTVILAPVATAAWMRQVIGAS